MPTGIHIDTSGLNLGSFEERLNVGIEMYGKTAALQFEAKAKEDAKWEDRTGEARRRLKGDFVEAPIGWALTLSQGVDYGIYLELAHERDKAILMPTILSLQTSFVSALRTMLKIK